MNTAAIKGISDQLLIEAYLSGHTEAFNVLVDRHKDKIYTSIFLLLKDKSLSEDIFQETFIRIIHKVAEGKYNEEGKFLPWAIRIARNLCLDYFRKEKRNPFAQSISSEAMTTNLEFADAGVEAKMVLREEYGELMRALSRIPLEQQDVIILRHFTGLSFKDIANLTGCSTNTALGRMRYGLMNLRKEWEKAALSKKINRA